MRGRGFRLRLVLGGTPRVLRIEVTDARGDRLPAPQDAAAEGGRGLPLVVSALADRWGGVPFPPSGKTVWAGISLAPPLSGPVNG
ncbi:ATP-binding protein [Streptomyces sp. NBC_00057]|uniref:ATP-binding protein n=1 Tax=Streptomyces sp. NBC_00057 TaxID=2975634 RepID=UPI003865A965